VPAGTVLDAVAPATSWHLTGPHGAVGRASSSFGYAATFHVARPGTVTVAFEGSWSHAVEIAVETAAWVVLAAALAGRAWWLDWWWGPLGRGGSRRHRRRRFTGTAVGPEPVPEPGVTSSEAMREVVT